MASKHEQQDRHEADDGQCVARELVPGAPQVLPPGFAFQLPQSVAP